MKVLLIQPPIEDFYTTPIRLYPLGLLYVAAAFRDMGAYVQILDCLNPLKKRQLPIPDDFEYLKPFLENNPLLFQRYYRFGLSPEAIRAAVQSADPDLIGISSQFSAYYKSVADLIELIAGCNQAPIVLGGNHATLFGPEIIETSNRRLQVLYGPAENSVPKLVCALCENDRLSPEPLDWRRLQPAHALLEKGRYRMGKQNYVSLTASRGCPHHCDFCSVHAMFGLGIDHRAVESVLSEMRWNYSYREVRIFNFEDDNLSFDRTWFQHLLAAIINDPLLEGIELTAMNGFDYTTLDEDLLQMMHAAGFKQINLAHVTLDAMLRKRYHRPRRKNRLEAVVKAAQNHGFFITVYVIIGLPDQTAKEVKDSIDYLLDLGVLVGPSVFYIPPGSRLYDRLDLPAHVKNNWNLYRSSAFAVETAHLNRADLVRLFSYVREKNLQNKQTRSDR